MCWDGGEHNVMGIVGSVGSHGEIVVLQGGHKAPVTKKEKDDRDDLVRKTVSDREIWVKRNIAYN